MSELTNTFYDIANAIRYKENSSNTYKPNEMANAINNIQSGGGAFVLTSGSVTGSFNIPVVIPDSVTNMANAFRQCSNFNQPVTIPANVNGLFGIFSGCAVLNQPITFPENALGSMAQAFLGCSNFNYPVRLPQGINNLQAVFSNCFNFNQPVIIPEMTITSQLQTATMFANCHNLNQPVVFPSTAKVLTSVFSNCRNLNQAVLIPPTVNNVQYMFTDCYNFGADIIFLNDANMVARGVQYMIENSNISIHKRIICNNASLFTSDMYCIGRWDSEWQQSGDNYFQPDLNVTVVGNAVAEFNAQANYGMYFKDSANASEIKPVMVFGDNVNNLSQAFAGSPNFNSYVIIGNNVEEMEGTFSGCWNFNKPIVFPESIAYTPDLLRGCFNWASTLIFRNTANLYPWDGTLDDVDPDNHKLIVCDNASKFFNCIRGARWTQDGNTYYNATYNIMIKQI